MTTGHGTCSMIESRSEAGYAETVLESSDPYSCFLDVRFGIAEDGNRHFFYKDSPGLGYRHSTDDTIGSAVRRRRAARADGHLPGAGRWRARGSSGNATNTTGAARARPVRWRPARTAGSTCSRTASASAGT